ncbi:MAG: hypothetical protein JNL72_08975 [Flavipsychrobacter sp.]|nr:hypothetical protein [Flavipsychrobacter sp.]
MAFDNLFDGLQAATFDTVTAIMGYTAVWQPSDGSSMQTARVLFKNPTEGEKIGDQEYDPYRYTMEYKEGVFGGLKPSVDANNVEEITIGAVSYYVRKVDGKFDGKTMIAALEVKG